METRDDLALPDWIAQAGTLEHTPRHTRQINAACTRHIERFPRKLVTVELDTAVPSCCAIPAASAVRIVAIAPITGPWRRSWT